MLATIPPRTSICLDCRTALFEGEACDAGQKHRVTTLTTQAGKQKLLDEVWGPANGRRQLQRAARAAGGGGVIAWLFEGCTVADCGGCEAAIGVSGALAAIVAFAVGALLAVVLVWVAYGLVQNIRARMNRRLPFGALSDGPSMRGRGLRGTVVAEERSDSPLSDEPSIAYAIEYRAKRVASRAVMLRDAATRGFDVLTKEGRKIRIPATRIRLDGTPTRISGSYGRSNANAHAARIDLTSNASSSYSVPTDEGFPWGEVVQTLLKPGDEVEVLGELAPVLDPDAPSEYRESASSLVPVGVPYLVKLTA